MKKKLSLLMIVFMAVAAFAIQVGKRASATTWTVAGNSTELFGSAWDPTATANDMTLDGDVYKWTKTDVALPAFTEVQFKVCGDHAWTVAFPAENYGFTIPENGKYTVVITFNAATEEITATATKTGDATFPDAEITKVQICGATDASWTNRIDFGLTKGEGNVYTGVLDASAYEDDVEFKLVVNGDTWIGFDQLTMNAPDGWVEKPEGNDNFLLKNSSTRYKSYNITATWVSNALANKGWTVKIEGKEPRTKDVTISPASGDISEAINAELGSNYFAKNLTINLAENGAYTVTAPIEAGGSIVINGAEGATIDASGNEGAFAQLSSSPAVEVNAKSAYIVDAVTVKDVKVTGVKGSLFWDGNVKYGVTSFTIENAVIELAETAVKSESVIAFQAGGAKDFTIKNSTIYSKIAPVAKYFLRYNNSGRLDNLGYDKEKELQNWVYVNNTFYNVLKSDGQWGNGPNGQKYMSYDVEKNIWYNCGKDIIRRLLNGRANGSNPMTFAKNTYFNADADISASESGYDKSGDILTTNPNFKDAANGDFTLEATSAQVTNSTGDPRWYATPYTGFAVSVADGITNGTVKVSQDKAAEGTDVTVTITPAEGYILGALTVKKADDTEVSVSGGKFKMPAEAVTVSATFVKVSDITIAAADITDGKITEAIAAKKAAMAEGELVRNVTITLAASTAYTVTAPIEAGGSIVINGAEGATIDASALNAPFIQMSPTPAVDGVDVEGVTAYPIDGITIKDVAITGLNAQLFYANKIQYLLQKLSVDNSVIGIAKAKTIFDFNSGGNVVELSVNKSTIYGPADGWSNGGFHSTQSSKSVLQLGGEAEKTIITNSTLYSIAYGKTTSTIVKNSQTWMSYEVKNNVIVNCGKNGQFLKGLNAGQAGKDGNWDVDGNVFNFDGANVVETAGVSADIVKNSIAGVVTFTDAAAGDFNGKFTPASGTTAPETMPGDPRWTLTAVAIYTITKGEITNGTVEVASSAAEGEKVYPILTPAEGYAVEKLPTIKNEAGDDVTSSITFGEDETGKYFVMPAFNITVSLEFSKLNTVTLPAETTNGTITLVDGDGNALPEGTKFVAGKEIKLKVTGLADGYKVVVKNGDTDITLNEGDHTKYDYYFTMPEGDVTISIVDGTGINGITVDGVSGDIFSDGKPVYNLSGQRVFKGYKGIVIKNGRKVVIK